MSLKRVHKVHSTQKKQQLKLRTLLDTNFKQKRWIKTFALYYVKVKKKKKLVFSEIHEHSFLKPNYELMVHKKKKNWSSLDSLKKIQMMFLILAESFCPTSRWSTNHGEVIATDQQSQHAKPPTDLYTLDVQRISIFSGIPVKRLLFTAHSKNNAL